MGVRRAGQADRAASLEADLEAAHRELSEGREALAQVMIDLNLSIDEKTSPSCDSWASNLPLAMSIDSARTDSQPDRTRACIAFPP